MIKNISPIRFPLIQFRIEGGGETAIVWTSRQNIARKPFTVTFTSMASLESPNSLRSCLWTLAGRWSTWRGNANSTQKERPARGSNPGASC